MIGVRLILLVLAFSIGPSPAAAQSAEAKGQRIAEAAEARSSGFGDSQAEGRMILRNARGGTSERRFEVKSLETTGGSRTIMVFDWPGDIRDTALLTHTFDVGEDIQWLFLPSIRRAKRISGADRSGSFMGSEFAYEDMVGQSPAKYRHTWLRDEPCPVADDRDCHVLDRVPNEAGGYSRQRVWLDVGELRVQRVDFYDRGGAKLKSMTVSGYRSYNGRFWRPSTVRMVNHLTGKSTDLFWSGYRFGVGLNPAQFTVNALRNMR